MKHEVTNFTLCTIQFGIWTRIVHVSAITAVVPKVLGSYENLQLPLPLPISSQGSKLRFSVDIFFQPIDVAKK